jgi:hypothetical protein
MHYFSIRARPRPRAPIDPGSSGARIGCWINFPLREGALAVARHYLAEDGWSIRSIDEHRVIEAVAKLPAAERPHAREAKRHGACFVYRHEPAKRRR